jgi:hypothetical protein
VLSTLVILLKSSQGEEFRHATLGSILLASSLVNLDVKMVETPPEGISQAIESSSAEVVLLAYPGAIFLPDFFSAMLVTMDHHAVDYVGCRCAVVSRSAEKPMVVRAGEAGFDIAQVMIKRWLCREIGINSANPLESVEKAINEYHGCDVPHVLVMRA